MSTWIIEPRDPLIVRDGRPFGPNPGARAKSLSFPFPSTTTGGIRTRAGLDQNGIFDEDRISQIKSIQVRGPMLVELDEQDEVKEWLFPAPADALLLPYDNETENKSEVVCRQLVPLHPPADAQTNLPADLALVGLASPDQRKPYKNSPRFWYWSAFKKWLAAPQDEQQIDLGNLGHSGPLFEQRLHVSIQPETLTSVEGALFQTGGLEFVRASDPKNGLQAMTRLGLVLEADTELSEGIAPLGGERRLMRWRKTEAVWPSLPSEVKTTIAQNKACRVLLVTPAYFNEGYRPQGLLNERNGVKPTLKAVAIQRPQVISGWDFDLGRPKPTRRLAPVGTIYFLSLEGDTAAIEQWSEEMWLQCISDTEQDRWDGFGLAALGSWSGQLQRMEVG